MEKTKTYFIRFKPSFDTIPQVEREMEFLDNRLGIGNLIKIGYYLPQPVYKSWVPNWIIRLITKR